MSRYETLIVGGGPAGLSAALALGRARRRVLLADAGERRNAAATHLHNFVTRDGTPPEEFRRIARAELAAYENVEVRDEHVQAIDGAHGAFRVRLPGETVEARRVLLATGMIDEGLPIAGFRELWGRSIFQCPYCHGWEVRGRAWGYLGRARDANHLLPFSLMLTAWTEKLTVFTHAELEVPGAALDRLRIAGVRVETGRIARLLQGDGGLEAVELDDGRSVACEALFAHPPQRHVELVRALGIALDDDGFVRSDAMTRETSIPGIYAAGDLTTRGQGAVLAAAAGAQAGAMLNVDLAMELPAKEAEKRG